MAHYILFSRHIDSHDGSSSLSASTFEFVLSAELSNGLDLQLNDRLLLMSKQHGATQILPQTLHAQVIQGSAITTQLLARYRNPVMVDEARIILQRSLVPGLNVVTEGEFQAIIDRMGGVRLSENDMLAHIKHYIAARGYYFDDETLFNYHICLKTRPFVILAGLSGTGKSKLSQLYAEAIGHTVSEGRYLRLAVRPSWNDDRYLLGYFNTISNDYVTEPALDFILDAEADRRNLYFFCLDEMNLAHVEYYFSQFLSAMEEEYPADRRIILYGRSLEKRLASQSSRPGINRTVFLPTNLLFTGTINVDETTQPISDKVIDRANTIEFFQVALDKIPDKQPLPEPLDISADLWYSYTNPRPDTTYREHVIQISQILNDGQLGLGYRVVREIERYLANSHGLLEPDVAFDLQIKQRVLPRIRGAMPIRDMLRRLQAYVEQNGWSRSGERLKEMESRLKRDGYTSFWR